MSSIQQKTQEDWITVRVCAALKTAPVKAAVSAAIKQQLKEKMQERVLRSNELGELSKSLLTVLNDTISEKAERNEN